MLPFIRHPKSIRESLENAVIHTNPLYKSPEITFRHVRLISSPDADESVVTFPKTAPEHLGKLALAEAATPEQPTARQMQALGSADEVLKAFPRLDPRTFCKHEMDAVAYSRATDSLQNQAQ